MKVTQPIGDFFIGKMLASEINAISVIKRVKDDPREGTQRGLKDSKIASIVKDYEDPDVVFPTAIVLSVKQKMPLQSISIGEDDNAKVSAVTEIKSTDETKSTAETNAKSESCLWTFEYDETEKIAEIIDGQHRIVGISKAIEAGHKDIELPVVLMFNATREQKAYVFASINSNQTKVNKSTIYELFGLYETRSPLKTCHEIARAFNSTERSPFYRRLAMFGIKESGLESLTQGTFVDEILTLITRNSDTAKVDAIDIKTGKGLKTDPRRPLRRYFIQDQDEYIYRVLFNYFSAVAEVFQEEWEQPDKYILTKTTGFGALVSLFRKLCVIGFEKRDLSFDFFSEKFKKIKASFDLQKIELKSLHYGSGKFAQRLLRDEFLKPLGKEFNKLTPAPNESNDKKQLTSQDIYSMALAEFTARRAMSKKAAIKITKDAAKDNYPEEAIEMLDFLDDETAEHFYLLSPQNQEKMRKKIKKFVSSEGLEDFKKLRKLREIDYADDQEYLDNKQHIVDKLMTKIAEDFKDFIV